jgi:hypothetical protein
MRFSFWWSNTYSLSSRCGVPATGPGGGPPPEPEQATMPGPLWSLDSCSGGRRPPIAGQLPTHGGRQAAFWGVFRRRLRTCVKCSAAGLRVWG